MSPARIFNLTLPRLIGALAAVCLLLANGVRAQVITINEGFTGTSAPGWVFGGSGGSTIPYLTANTVDTDGTGWLRLTESLQNQSTYVLFDQQVFSVNAQIDITLEYTFWNGHNNLVQDGKGADGMTFFLVDASRDASNFQPGAFGGSLGYAQKTAVPGMAGGYLGFGFDNWGNFAGATEGRSGGEGNVIAGYENRISVRGPDDGDGNNATGWDFIDASASLSSSMDFPLSTTRPDVTGADYRAFHLTLDANNQLTVEMKFGATSSFTTAFTADLSTYQRPDFFKIGFTAGTGSADETHEIRNVEVSMTPFQAGAYEWDNGAGTTAWGATPGGANTNWYHADSLLDNLSPTPDSDILFAQKPLSGPQTVELNTDLQLRSFTFDTNYNYTLSGSGVFTLGNTGLVGLPSINVNDYNGAQARHKINNALVLVEELRINNYSLSTLCLNGTISLSANDLSLNGTGAVNFNAALVGTGNVIKNGSGLLTVNAASANYSGSFTLYSGQTVVTIDGALGNTAGGTTVGSGASLTFRGGVNYATAETTTISGDGWAFNGHSIGALYGDGGTNTFAGNVVLAANSAVGARDGSLTLTGSISGAFNLAKVGYGVVVLANSNNAYTGSTSINAGVLRVTSSSNSLPGGFTTGGTSGGNLVLNGGVLEIGVSDTFSRTLGTGADEVQFTGDGGFSAFGGTRSVSLSSGAALTWASTTGFLGDGQSLILSSAYSDNTIDFQNALNLNGAARTVRVENGTAAVDGRLSGILSGTGASGLVKTGTGTLDLTAANTYVGTTEIQAGALRVTTTSLPGGYDTSDTANNYGAVNLNGGVLELASNTTFTRTLGTGEEQIYFGGSGGFAASGGARTVSLSGGATLTWNSTSGFLTTGNSLILGSTSSDNTLTFQNAINLNGEARTIVVQNGSGTIDAQLTGVISNGSLTVSGAGVLTTTAANTLAGTLSVSGAEFRLTGNGTIASISNVFVGNGGTLTLDNVATNNNNRVTNSASVTLSGGTLSFLGDNDADTSEQLTNLTISGDNIVNIQPGATNRSMTVTFSGSLTRNAGATANFTNLASGGDALDNNGTGTNPRIYFGTAPTLNDGILAYATVSGDSFATVTTNYLHAATTTTTSLNAAATTDNVGVTASTISVSADRTINSLRLDRSSTITISNGVTLNIESGGLLQRTGSSSTITGGTLTARGSTSLSDLITFVHSGSTLSVSSVLANNSGGSVGLTKAGVGTLVLSGSTANTLTGDTAVTGGTLRLLKSDSVTALAGNITVGDNSGLDRLEIRANEQLANTANVTLNGSDASNRATLDLGGFTETFATLTVNGNAVLDFGGGNVCTPSFLYLDDLNITGDSTLLIKNWIEFTTFLLVKNTSANTEGALPKIQFEGYGEAASWLTYDSTWSMIAPVPEPSTYGAILLGAGLAVVAWRRRRAAPVAAQVQSRS